MERINTRMLAGETGVENYTFQGIDKLAGFAPVGINGWSIGATQDLEELMSATVFIRNSIVTIAVVAGILISGIIFLASRSIVRPINAAVAGLKDIAQGEGDLTMRLKIASRI